MQATFILYLTYKADIKNHTNTLPDGVASVYSAKYPCRDTSLASVYIASYVATYICDLACKNGPCGYKLHPFALL